MNLLVTRWANADSRPEVLAVALVFSFGVLLRGEVMFGEFWAGAIAQFTDGFADSLAVRHR